MIAHEPEMRRHRTETVPPRERRGFDHDAREAAGRFDVRIDRTRERREVVCRERGLWSHVQDGMYSIEVVFDHGPSSRGPPSPNAALQARPMAGARDERRLLGVAC